MDRIRKLKELLKNNASDPFIFFALAKEHEIISDYCYAEEYYKKAISLDQTDLSYVYNYGLMLKRAGKTEMYSNIKIQGLLKAKENMDFQYIDLFSE